MGGKHHPIMGGNMRAAFDSANVPPYRLLVPTARLARQLLLLTHALALDCVRANKGEEVLGIVMGFLCSSRPGPLELPRCNRITGRPQ